MKTIFSTTLVVAALVVLTIVPGAAAPNLYGTAGLLEVPDDVVYDVGEWTPAFHAVMDIGSSDNDVKTFTVGTGILPNLSISGGVISNGDDEVLLNAKYRLSPETVDRPSITIGVIDALSEVNEDPALYIVFGKNLTAAAEEIAGGESRPLRGYAGFGSGVLSGFFVGLDWTLTSKLSAMLEYVNSDESPFASGSHFNGGIRYALTNEWRLDAALTDFDNLTIGASYNALRF